MIETGAQKTQRVLLQIILWFTLVSLGVAVFSAIQSGVSHGVVDALLVLLSVIVLLALALLWTKTNIGEKKFIIGYLLVSMAVNMFIAFVFRPEILTDYQRLLRAATETAQGQPFFDPSNHWHYFTLYAYQTGFVLYEAFFIALFGASAVKIIMILNCLYISITGLFVYRIAKRLVSVKYAQIAAILYLLYQDCSGYFMTGALTNQHLATVLFCAGVYTLMAKYNRHFAYYILAGVLLALGNIARPEAIVIFASILVFGLCCFKRLKDKDELRKAVIRAVGFAAAYAVIFYGASFAVSASGVNPYGLKSNDGLYKFSVGLNIDSAGKYSDDFFKQIKNIPFEERSAFHIPFIKEQLSHPLGQARLYAEKQSILWGFSYPGHSGTYVPRYLDKAKLKLAGSALNYPIFAAYIIAVVFAFAACLSQLKAREKNKPALLPLIMIAVFIGVYLFIEVQMRYRHFIMPYMFAVSALGLQWASERFQQVPLLRK